MEYNNIFIKMRKIILIFFFFNLKKNIYIYFSFFTISIFITIFSKDILSHDTSNIFKINHLHHFNIEKCENPLNSKSGWMDRADSAIGV